MLADETNHFSVEVKRRLLCFMPSDHAQQTGLTSMFRGNIEVDIVGYFLSIREKICGDNLALLRSPEEVARVRKPEEATLILS